MSATSPHAPSSTGAVATPVQLNGASPSLPRRRPHWLVGLLLLRCPACRSGRLFTGSFAMNTACPMCGLTFQREPGYFLGAMYFSYTLGIAIMVPLFYLFQWLFPTWPGVLVAAVAVLPYIPLTPLVFRYSRALWLYFDRSADPGDALRRGR
jgi:uncharacterized protein (DUF983 family)